MSETGHALPWRRLVLLLACVAVLTLVFLFAMTPRTDPGAAPPPRAPSTVESVAARLGPLAGNRGQIGAQLVTTWLEDAWPEPTAVGRAAILDGLLHRDPDVRWVALVAAPRFGPADGAFVDALLAREEDPAAHISTLARSALENLEAPSADALRLLRLALPGATPELRTVLLRTLGQHGSEPETFELLLAHLLGTDVEIRRAAAFGLAAWQSLEPSTLEPEVLTGISAALGDEDADVRARAARFLSRLGRYAEPTIPRLVACLGDEDNRVMRWSLDALVACGEPAVAPLREALHADAHPRPDALVLGLRRIDTPSSQAALTDALTHDDPHVRADSALSLQERLGATPTLVATLGKLLEERDPDVLAAALQGLGLAGPDALSTHRVRIEKLQQHDDATVRIAAAMALEMLKSD